MHAHDLTISHKLRRGRRALIGAAGVGIAAAAIGTAAAVEGPAPHAMAATSPSLLTFNLTETAGSQAGVKFTGGAGPIANQLITGTSLTGTGTSQSAFDVVAGPRAANTSSNYMTVPLTGSTITGDASIPAGDTITVSISGGAPITLTNGAFSIPVPTGVGTGQGATPSVTVTPGTVHAGKRVMVHGVAPAGAKAGATVTLMSAAFPHRHTVDGMPAITAKVRAHRMFSTTVTIPATVKRGSYGVSGRVGKHYVESGVLKVQR
jgi:hypothetical protein